MFRVLDLWQEHRKAEPLECVWRSPEGTQTPLWLEHGQDAMLAREPKRRRRPYGTLPPHSKGLRVIARAGNRDSIAYHRTALVIEAPKACASSQCIGNQP